MRDGRICLICWQSLNPIKRATEQTIIMNCHNVSRTMYTVNYTVFCTGFLPDYTLRNVAWLKRTYQVSTFTDQYGPHPSRLANDGSRQTNYNVTVNGCSASKPATNPWWAVDLGAPTVVFRVNLTNRGDFYGTCLRFDRIKVYPSAHGNLISIYPASKQC